MCGLPEVQTIFNNAFERFTQSYDKDRQTAVLESAHAAFAAAIALTNEDTATAVKEAVRTAGEEANNLPQNSINGVRESFDHQFVRSMKGQLESYFNVQGLTYSENPSFVFGKGYFAVGLYDSAIDVFTVAMEDYSCRTDACLYLARTFIRKKNPIDAEDTFGRLLAEKNPKLLRDNYNRIGMCYFEEGMFDYALLNMTSAVDSDPANRSVLYNLSRIYLALAWEIKSKYKNYVDFTQSDKNSFSAYHTTSQNLLNELLEFTPDCPELLCTQAKWYELFESYGWAIEEIREHAATIIQRQWRFFRQNKVAMQNSDVNIEETTELLR